MTTTITGTPEVGARVIGTANLEELPVGEPITTRAQLHALPVGSVLRANSGQHYVKTADRVWYYASPEPPHPANGRRYGSGADFSLDRFNTVVRVGTALAPAHGYQVGDDAGINDPDAETFASLPIGTVMEYGSSTYTKIRANWWEGSGEHEDEWWNEPGTIVLLPDRTASPGRAPAANAAEVVAAAKAEVRRVIQRCVGDNDWGWVAQGAYWMLGIDPLPAVDTEILYGSVFGLPLGSVVRYRSALMRVDNDRDPYPNLLTGRRADNDYNARCRVVLLGEYTEPSYGGRNQFLHAVWERERLLRTTHSWCRAVESCLTDAGLADPGDIPDTPPVPDLSVGDVLDTRGEPGMVARLQALPLGSTIHVGRGGPGICVRTDSTRHGWVTVDSLSPYNLEDKVGISIRSIAQL